MLVRAGVVERWEDGNRVSYRLSESGRELEPVVEALGRWGIRWIPELGDDDLDPHLLLWDVHRNTDTEAVPDGRTVIGFDFTDVPGAARHWWIVDHRRGGGRLRQRPGSSGPRHGGGVAAHVDPGVARRRRLGERAALRGAGPAR